MKLGWKRPAKPAPTGGAPGAERCNHRFARHIRRRSYWVRSTLMTDTSVVCSNCGQPINGQRSAR